MDTYIHNKLKVMESGRGKDKKEEGLIESERAGER